MAQAVKHARSSAQYKGCRLGNDTIHQPLSKGGKRVLAESVRDPELVLIVDTCKRYPEGHAKAGKALPPSQQSRAWLALRDAYAAKNYSLVFRAAERQSQTNQHLVRERMACRYCPGKPTCGHELKDFRCETCLTGCNRCKNTGWYVGQPDLEALAYAGLLEAIRLCDFSKGGNKISTYAVWLMKQSMMPLLRQTPVFYPQELLRDRRVLAALKKSLKREYTEVEAEIALLAIRKNKTTESCLERRLLAEGCYYGQEKSSVEALQSLYVERSSKFERRMRRGKASTVLDALSTKEVSVDTEDEELRAALLELSPAERKEADKWLRGRSPTIPAGLVDRLRELML